MSLDKKFAYLTNSVTYGACPFRYRSSIVSKRISAHPVVAQFWYTVTVCFRPKAGIHQPIERGVKDVAIRYVAQAAKTLVFDREPCNRCRAIEYVEADSLVRRDLGSRISDIVAPG